MSQKISKSIYLLSPSSRDEAEHLPMIEFSLAVDKIDFSMCDTLMFSSKQAVKSADLIDKTWKNFPCIAIGGATKKQIEILGGKVIYHPKNFYADELASDIAKLFSDREILYLRPKEISFDSKGFLKSKNIELHEQIIYETSCVKYMAHDAPIENAVIIFTSPSSIRCFFENFSWHESYMAIVIGNATKIHLPKEVKFVVASSPLIDSCIEKAIEIAR